MRFRGRFLLTRHHRDGDRPHVLRAYAVCNLFSRPRDDLDALCSGALKIAVPLPEPMT